MMKQKKSGKAFDYKVASTFSHGPIHSSYMRKNQSPILRPVAIKKSPLQQR
ncbi:MAG TPA: hypothetical protein VFP93_02725 [Gammaproteobacteria bacterium]|nr:hypothetical protein [Gammaproteobacteria bacterium]